MPCSVASDPNRAPDLLLLRSGAICLISAEGKVDRLEACTALLPPQAAELGAQQREAAVVGAAAEPDAQPEVVAVAVVPDAEPEAAVAAVAVVPDAQPEPAVVAVAVVPDAQPEAAVVAVAVVPDAQPEPAVVVAVAVAVVVAAPDAQPEAAVVAVAPDVQQEEVTAAPSEMRQREPSAESPEAAADRLWFRARPASARALAMLSA